MSPTPLSIRLPEILFARIETGVNINEINPLKDIALISPRPVYIVHGTGDTVAPPDAGQKLSEAAGEPRFIWEAENVRHLMIYLDNPGQLPAAAARLLR